MTNTAIKIIGFVLLVSGIVIIGWAMLSSFNIFTGKASAPEIFKAPIEKTINQKCSSAFILSSTIHEIEEFNSSIRVPKLSIICKYSPSFPIAPL